MSNFQQPVRRNRNDGKTCTFSAWILCEVKKNVPRSLPNSMIWENLGQIFFSLNFCPFSETCVLNKVLRVTESSSILHSICARNFVKPRKVLAFVAKFDDSRKSRRNIFFKQILPVFQKNVFSTRFYVLEELF